MTTARLHDSDMALANPLPARLREGARDSISPAPLDRSSAVRPRLLGVREAALYLSLSHWTVRQLVWDGQLPAVRIGRRLLFDVRDLDALIDRSKRRETI